MVEEFEKDFATFCECRHCVAVSSGTDALRFALMAAGVEPGDVVLTVPNTFIATTEAISQAGAPPEFVDIDERTYNISVAEAAAVSRSRSARRDASGKLHQPAQRAAGHRRGSGASLRPDGGHGPHPRAGRASTA